MPGWPMAAHPRRIAPVGPARHRLPHGLRGAVRGARASSRPRPLGHPRRRSAGSAAGGLVVVLLGARSRHQRHRQLAAAVPAPLPRHGAVCRTAAAQHPVPRAGTSLGQRVIIVGGGNTAAQLLAELSLVAHTTWMTLHPPHFLPDDVDGRVLFQRTAARRRALAAGQPDPGPTGSLGDIVMVPRCTPPGTAESSPPCPCSPG